MMMNMKCINTRGASTPQIHYLIENGTDQAQPVDSLFTLNPIDPGLIEVHTDDQNVLGTFKFKITCWWAEVPLYKYTFFTTVDIVPICSKNVIGSVQQVDPYYEVQDPRQSFKLLEWSISMPQCKPFTYELQLFGASPLPSFIKYDSKGNQLFIQTDNGLNEGFYSIVMKGYTKYYMEMLNIPIDTIFKVNIKCVPNSLSPARNGGIKRTFYIGQPHPMEQTFLEFIISPICYKVQYYVIYSATTTDGKPLPNHISFDDE